MRQAEQPDACHYFLRRIYRLRIQSSVISSKSFCIRTNAATTSSSKPDVLLVIEIAAIISSVVFLSILISILEVPVLQNPRAELPVLLCDPSYFVAPAINNVKNKDYFHTNSSYSCFNSLPNSCIAGNAYQKHHHGSADRPGNDKRKSNAASRESPAV